MSENQAEAFNGTNVPEPVEQLEQSTAAPSQETGTKRPRSNSLEAAAAQALTQLDGPPHHRQQSTGGFQPTLGPPQPMHPSQYSNAFSAGQNPGQQQQQQVDPAFSTPQMSQSPAFRPNTGSPVNATPTGQLAGSPAGGRAPGAHQARQRTAVACRYCRKRKIRCTGISHDPNDPRCSNCRRLDQECIYAPVGAPQGNYTRQPMPDAYGRGHPFHPMPQQMMQGQHQQWQGQPMGYPPQPYMQYAQGRGVPGPDGQHQFQQGQGYAPGPGYPPQGQHYHYDNSYPNYVNDPNAAQAQGQFGRLKPETFAVYPSPTAHQPHPSVIDPAVQQASELPEPVPEAVSETPAQGQEPQTQESKGTEVIQEAAAAEEVAPALEPVEKVPEANNDVAPVVSEPTVSAPEVSQPESSEGKAQGNEQAVAQESTTDPIVQGGTDNVESGIALEEPISSENEKAAVNATEEGTNLLPNIESSNDLPAPTEENTEKLPTPVDTETATANE